MRKINDGDPGIKRTVQVDAELEDLIPEFLGEMHENANAIKEAVALKDYEAIRLLGHRCKGTASSYGFDAIVQMSHSMELAAKDQDLAEVKNLADQFGRYLEHVVVVFE